MAIVTDDAILKFGTKDVIDETAGTIAADAFSVAADVDSTWANDENAPLGAALLKCQYDATMPTVGSIGLYARLLNVDGAGDMPVPSGGYPHIYVATFPIDFGVAADVDFYTMPEGLFQMPALQLDQIIEWYLKNDGTGRVLGTAWKLWVAPMALGPKG